MTKFILTLGILLTCATWSMGQQTTDQVPSGALAQTEAKASIGTFQLVQKTKIAEAFNDELLVTIESHRAEDKEVYLDLSPNTQVRILSRKEITSPDFKPLEDLYFTESK